MNQSIPLWKNINSQRKTREGKGNYKTTRKQEDGISKSLNR